MQTGFQGASVISWSQTETDGLCAAPMDVLTVGATWRWTGQAARMDGPQEVLVLHGAEGAEELRRRAARMVRRLIGAAPGPGVAARGQGRADRMADAGPFGQGFVLTDGRHSFTATILPVPDSSDLLVMFLGAMPPADRELWVVRAPVGGTGGSRGDTPAAMICFTPDTRILTPQGPRMIGSLMPGDPVLTRDNGPQPVIWTGHRRMTGARLHAMPDLRPIRFRSAALGRGRPDGDLLVSPQHRMLVCGPAAQALFNTPEVLVAARDLVNDRSIGVDRSLREVTYVHILLEKHNIVWANGLEAESFHPSNTAMEMIDPAQRGGLLAVLPDLDADPLAYGDFARRNLTGAEAAILRHDLA